MNNKCNNIIGSIFSTPLFHYPSISYESPYPSGPINKVLNDLFVLYLFMLGTQPNILYRQCKKEESLLKFY